MSGKPIAFTGGGSNCISEVDMAQPVTGRHGDPGMVAFAQNQRDEVRTMDVAGALASEPEMKQQTYVAIGDDYAGAYEADASSVLSTLRKAVGAEAVAEWGSRVLDSLQAPEVLRSWLHGESLRRASGDFRSFVGDRPLPRKEGSAAATLRQVWQEGPDGCSSQGRGLARQLAYELGEALPQLPSLGAFRAETVQRLRRGAEGARSLRQTLSAIQALGRSARHEDQPAHAAYQVRRLTPRECARLQGFPDSYLDIPYRGKPAADGNKYKALGNSMAVPVMRWIGERIAMVEEMMTPDSGDEANG